MVQITSFLATCASVLLFTLPVLAQGPALNTSAFPPSCTTCSKLATDLGACSTNISCLCGGGIGQELSACAQCAVDAGAPADSLNSALSSYISTCKSAGVPSNISSTVKGSGGATGATSAAVSAGLSLGLLGAIAGLGLSGLLA